MGKKTGPVCQVCASPQRHLVELGLVHRVSLRVLAKRFSLDQTSIHRHRHRHMSPQLVAAMLTALRPSDVDLEALQRSESEGLLGNLVAQRARLQLLSEMCFEDGELHAATTVERAITSSLELTSKLLGMIVQRHDVRSTSILISADYLKLRQTLIAALRPFPEAARAVGAALAQLETEAAEDIASKTPPLLLEASAEAGAC
jgi:hypothetical protein